MNRRKITANLCSKKYFLAVTLSVVIGSFLLLSGRAFAGGGVGTGGGGTGGGSTAGYGTRNGHGWLLYDTNGPGPSGGFRNGTAWGTVQGICQGANASGVMVFGIANSAGNIKGYNYIQDYSIGHYAAGTSVDGGRATAIDTFWAQASFNDLPNKGVSTAGFTFGGASGNVAWFCTGIDNVNHDPAGDSAMNCTAGFQGWVLDADNLNARLGIAIVIKPPGTGWNDPTSYKINDTANQAIPNPPFNTAALAAFGVTGNRGFTIALPSQFKNGTNYDWLIIAANAAGTPSNPLGFSVLGQGTFNCPVPSVGFRITPKADAALKPDVEDPNQVILKSGIINSAAVGVKGGTVKRSYYVRRISGGAPVPLPGIVNKVDNRTLTTFDYPDETVTIAPGFLQPGDRVCVEVYVSPASGTVDSTGNLVSTGTPATDSIEGCDRLVNRPYVTFSGGDVAAGGVFGSGACASGDIKTNSKGAAPWGSAAQLAVQAVGSIDGLPSARWRSNPGPVKGLSFANTDPASVYGGSFNNCQRMPDYFAEASALTPSNKSGAVAVPTSSGNQYWKASSASGISLDSGGNVSIPNNTHVKLYIEGNVTIAHNITYAGAGGWTSADQIPSFQLYVKGNIFISNNVTQLDGVYVAQPATIPTDGVINTCAEATDPNRLSKVYNSCNNKLTVYGAFMARHVDLMRSAGKSLRNAAGDTTPFSTSAAEQFILSPEAFIAKYSDNPTTCITSPNSCGPKFFYQTSLPPIL